MRALNRDLLQLQRRAGGDGVHATRRDRSYVLARAADTPHELGFRGLRATGLRRKHVNALVAEWQRRGLAAGTIKNRTAHIRRWAKRVDPPGVVPANGALAILIRPGCPLRKAKAESGATVGGSPRLGSALDASLRNGNGGAMRGWREGAIGRLGHASGGATRARNFCLGSQNSPSGILHTAGNNSLREFSRFPGGAVAERAQ